MDENVLRKIQIINEKKSRIEVGTVLHNGKQVIFKRINTAVRSSEEMQRQEQYIRLHKGKTELVKLHRFNWLVPERKNCM